MLNSIIDQSKIKGWESSKLLLYFQKMGKTRSAMVFTLMAMCASFVYFTPLCSNAQTTTLLIKEKVVPDDPSPLYVFGDSLYDTGMAFYIDKGPVADSYPYGTTYFKRPAGRFSDGRLIPDFIAQFANLPFPEPYLNPKLTDFSKSVSFANAAAGVLVDGRLNTLNLEIQTDYYIDMVRKMEQQYGEEKTQKLVSSAIHIFNTGANDYVDHWNQNSKPLDPALINSLINKIFGNFTLHITKMYYHGARKFAFQGFGPVGCLPGFLEQDGKCAESLNDLIKIHNERFVPMAKTWARKLPGLKYTIFDFYTSLSARLANGTHYGFRETQSACCGSGPFNGKFSCMDKVNFTLCEDPTKHLWFDAGHPSEKADLQFAQEFWGGPPNLVHPYNLKTLFEMQTSS